MAYQELIKNFENTRDYMQDFYIFGFRSRNEFSQKSLRSYDNERRRIESWLQTYMHFYQTAEGKHVFVSIDSRHINKNPFYRAFKAKSFTNLDISLHFILLDILYDSKISYTLKEIIYLIDHVYLSKFENVILVDPSTIRKKINEYSTLGIFTSNKNGKQLMYQRSPMLDISKWEDAIQFFSEASIIGVIGSYLIDQFDLQNSMFTFKHHYITHGLDSEIIYFALCAIQAKRKVAIHQRKQPKNSKFSIIPLKIFISTQNGRGYLFGYHLQYQRIQSFRLDSIDQLLLQETTREFDHYRSKLTNMQQYMWGVCCSKQETIVEHVAFSIYLGDHEEYIYQRMQKEARCGKVERLSLHMCRFSADIYDTTEIIPWIRTFIGRILQLNFSNRTVENQFKKDLHAMLALYNLEGDKNDIS